MAQTGAQRNAIAGVVESASQKDDGILSILCGQSERPEREEILRVGPDDDLQALELPKSEAKRNLARLLASA